MYKMFNPYQHLTESFQLTAEQFDRMKFTKQEIATMDNGGVLELGASRVWNVEARKAVSARSK